MLCDNCKERDAIINLTQVEHDSKVTLHLCEQCAQQKGVETGGTVLKSPLGNFLGALGKGGGGGGGGAGGAGAGGALVPAPSDTVRCSECGSTLRDFRDSGRLGCDQCYVTFDAHLRDLLRRLHGSSQHVGERYEIPGEAGGDSDPRSRLLDLKAQLRRAVEGENFELAAELRDRIRVLE
jgi:protein arginine kinase activator